MNNAEKRALVLTSSCLLGWMLFLWSGLHGYLPGCIQSAFDWVLHKTILFIGIILLPGIIIQALYSK